MQSAFTIRVGEKQADGVRDVSVLHHNEVYFTTSQRNVKWAFLTRFPLLAEEKESQQSSAGVAVEDIFGGLSVERGSDQRKDEHAIAGNNNNNNNNSQGMLQEYLCVFYRDEPKNHLSHYTAHHPLTICSAYNTIHPASVTHFVLKNISPTHVVPGLRGVFVHGSRQSSRGASAKILRVGGFVFNEAADMWWMASQLTIKPVYVPFGDCELFTSLSLNATVAMVSSLHHTNSINSNSINNNSNNSGNMMPKYALIDATTLTQFQTCDGRLMAVAVRGSEVSLATTIVVEHLDALLWIWWPQRLHIPQLRVKGASVSVTVSESSQASVQALFLFDAIHSVLHILRTPNLRNGKGNLELLFTLSTNCPPLVLPCLRSSMMQPIMVCHYPDINHVSLYHVPELLRHPSASNYISTMSLASILPEHSIIDGILYHSGSTVTFQTLSRIGNDTKNNGKSLLEGKSYGTYMVGFPSLFEEQYPLVHFILEALEPVLEMECVASMQCELLRRAWEKKRLGHFWDFGTGCIELIEDFIHTSMTGCSINNNKNNNSGTRGENTSHSFDILGDEKKIRLCDILIDPFFLTADILHQHSSHNLHNKEIEDSSSSSHSHSRLSSINIGGLWSSYQCGMCVFVLHLLCESFKLQERLWVFLEPLAHLNLRLSQLMGWTPYVRYYSTCLCVPEASDINSISTTTTTTTTTTNTNNPNINKTIPSHITPSQLFQRTLPESVLLERFTFHAGSSTETVMSGAPPLLYTILQRVLAGKARISGGWPAIKGISSTSPLAMANSLFFMLVDCFDAPQPLQNLSSRWWYILCRGLLKYGVDPKFVASELCVGVAQPIQRALAIAKDHPEDTWDDDFNAIIGRLDRLQRASTLARYANPSGDVVRAAQERAIGRQYRATLNDDDGVIMRPDFPKHWGDSRVDIVQTMLNTAAPIPLPSQVDGADAIYTLLNTLTKRATALPVGRGMFTLCTQNFRVRDSVPIPRLNLEGRTSDGVTITNNSEEAIADNNIWPYFHNGCAAGLRFLPLPNFRGNETLKEEETIKRHWVLYQTRNIPCPASRSGLLLAAGLLGHLKVLQRTDIYSLLVSPQSQYSGREVVTIAVMLGLSCSLRGTCNSIVFNCLSMHVQSLTPATEDIEVSLDVQTAALISIGILYQRSPDAFLVEMLLIQISRLPSDEHFRDREGYALGAGFSLGLLLLGSGNSHGIPNVENRLLKFMEGARREAVPSACEGLETFNEINPDSGHFLTRALLTRNAKESFRNHCTRVFEGDCFNVTVSSPGAIMALGFMYLQTNDTSMAMKLTPPNRLVGLQGIYPELCLLRSMMSSLIMWSSIEPTREWLRRSIPSSLLRLAKYPQQSGLAPAQIRYLMMNLGHCLAGSVLALGIRFAGSMDADGKSLVLSELNGFIQGFIGSTGAVITTIQRATGAFQACISACSVALALIMAGTGDGQCLAVLQKLYKRTNVKYGDHLSISMATGLLFLGGGQLTLSTSLDSVAALIMSFYPIWPETASDNKMHLQALRHLYCLAVVPRIIETVDVLTNRSVSVPIRVIVHRGRLSHSEPSSVVKELWTPLPKGKEDQAVRMVTPCLLPDTSTVTQIEIRSAQHYNLTIYNSGQSVIGDGGLVVRVLEKNISHSDNKNTSRCSGEEVVVNWIQRLFREHPQQRPRPIEATVILDNVNLLFASQESFLTEFIPSEKEFSLDFVMNLRHTLERRYGGLLQRCGKLSLHHPLSDILLMQKSLYSTAVSLVQTLTNGGDAACELAPITESLHACATNTTNSNSNSTNSNMETQATGSSDVLGFSVSTVMKWLSQALHFHGIGGSIGLLPQALGRYEPLLQRHNQRLFALYRMNQQLLLRPQVLEELVNCCVEYVD